MLEIELQFNSAMSIPFVFEQILAVNQGIRGHLRPFFKRHFQKIYISHPTIRVRRRWNFWTFFEKGNLGIEAYRISAKSVGIEKREEKSKFLIGFISPTVRSENVYGLFSKVQRLFSELGTFAIRQIIKPYLKI